MESAKVLGCGANAVGSLRTGKLTAFPQHAIDIGGKLRRRYFPKAAVDTKGKVGKLEGTDPQENGEDLDEGDVMISRALQACGFPSSFQSSLLPNDIGVSVRVDGARADRFSRPEHEHLAETLVRGERESLGAGRQVLHLALPWHRHVAGPHAQPSQAWEARIAHLGATTKTTAVADVDPIQHRAVLSLSAEVTCDGPSACDMGNGDCVALAAQALLESAREIREQSAGEYAQMKPSVRAGHEELLSVLSTGKVVSVKANEPPSPFGHESFIVELVDEKSGKRDIALFKPAVEGNADGWHRAEIEVVAYRLNMMLGMDYVPPAVYRRDIGIVLNGRRYCKGALIHFVPRLVPLAHVHPTCWGVPVGRLLSDTRILDVLLQNSDRHLGHFLYGEHWALPGGDDRVPDAGTSGLTLHRQRAGGSEGGSINAARELRPVLIDHAAGFRQGAYVSMEHDNAFGTGPITSVCAHTYLRLRLLDEVLDYLDRLVRERGYNHTVMDY
eukprot:jgi/Mesvir1/12370/Mv00552-RA.3